MSDNRTLNRTLNQIVIAKNIMVPMRDGVGLATDIYRPAHNGEGLSGPFPTILCRTPYNKSDLRYVEVGEFFSQRGTIDTQNFAVSDWL